MSCMDEVFGKDKGKEGRPAFREPIGSALRVTSWCDELTTLLTGDRRATEGTGSTLIGVNPADLRGDRGTRLRASG